MNFQIAHESALGTPNLGIGETELAAVVRTMLLAARRARPKLLSLGMALHENTISVQVYNELPKVQRDMRLDTFEFQLEGIIHDHAGRIAKIDGRIDFKVKFRRQVGNYNDYFGIECKRIAASEPDLARYYVDSGVTKFANETYGAGHPSGMLVGYVVVPPADLALQRVRDRLERSGHKHGPWSAYPGYYRDTSIIQFELERTSGNPIRLLHAMVRMHD